MIGQNIKRYRQDAGLTQEELATRLGMKKQTVSSWEANRTEPTLGQCSSMAKIFGCSLDNLIGAEPKKPELKHDYIFGDFTIDTKPAEDEHYKALIKYMQLPKSKREMVDEYINFIARQV